MLKVNTLKELREERTRLTLKKSGLETGIKSDFSELKSELFSFGSVAKGAEGLLASEKNNVLGLSMGTVADFLTEKVLLRNSGFITKLILPYIVKKTTSNLVENNKTKIVGWLSRLTDKLAGEKK